MDPLHARVLKKKQRYLVDNLDFLYIRDYFIEDEIFNTEMIEEIDAEKTRTAKMRKFLEILPRRGAQAYPTFIKALVESKSPHVKEELEECLRSLQSGDQTTGRPVQVQQQPESRIIAQPESMTQPVGTAQPVQCSDEMEVEPSYANRNVDWSSQMTDEEKIRPLTSVHVAKLSSRLGFAWEQVAGVMGFSQAQIEQVKMSSPHNPRSWVSQLLSTWMRKNGQEATVGNLITVFKETGITDENVYTCLYC